MTSPDVQPVQLKGPDALGGSMEKAWYCDGVQRHDHDSSDASPFVRAVLAMVRRFIQAVDQVDFREREHFQEAMWTLGQLGVAEQELASLFATTPNSINRWMNGRSAPMPVVRPIVIRAGLDILRRDGMKIAGRRFDPITGRPITKAE